MHARKLAPGFVLERFGPLLIGVLAGGTATRLPSLWVLSATWREFLLDKAIDLEIGLFAGLLAIIAFLPALDEKTVIRKFKQWGYYRYVVLYLAEAVWVAGLAMVLSLAMIVLPDTWKTNNYINLTVSSLWWGLTVYSTATCFRIVKLALKSLLAH